MRLFGVHLPHPDQRELDRLLEQARASELTYDYVGAMLVADKRRASERREQIRLGTGPETFGQAVEALRAWQPQRGLGALVHPADAPIEVGSTLLVVLRAGPLAVVAPDRVVAVIDEPARFGFAYGTLAGHAETGEESFLIERSATDLVTATIRVDARAGTLPARLAAPMVRRLQRWALRRYLQVLEEAAQP
jgi:uncharacterized protein (UPF0548 family)